MNHVYAGFDIMQHIEGIRKALEGIRMNFKPSMRELLKKVGQIPIIKIYVCRRPLSSKFSTIINFINKKETHDKLFHLFLILELQDGQKIMLEKNEDLNIANYKKSNVDEVIEIQSYNQTMMKTINELLKNAIDTYGNKKIFEYDAFSTNCQQFVIDILGGSNIMIDNTTKNFILQDVKDLVPSWAQRLAHGVTSFYNRLKMMIQGYGLQFNNNSHCVACGGFYHDINKHNISNDHYKNIFGITYLD